MGSVKAIASSLNGVENITMNFCGHSNFTHWIQSRHAITPRESFVELDLNRIWICSRQASEDQFKKFWNFLPFFDQNNWQFFLFPTINLTNFAKLLGKIDHTSHIKILKRKGKKKTWWRHIKGIRKLKKTQHRYPCLVIKGLRFLKTAKKVHWV